MGRGFTAGGISMNALRALFVSLLLVQSGAVMADGLQPAPGELEEIVTTSARESEIRQIFASLLQQGGRGVRRVGESFMPAEPQPGLQFNIDPDTDEVYVGWRFQF